MKSLKAKLWLEPLDGRVLPDAAPTDPPPDPTASQDSSDTLVNSVTLGVTTNPGNQVGPWTLDITLVKNDGTQVKIQTITFATNAAGLIVADQIVNQLKAEGFDAVIVGNATASFRVNGIKEINMDAKNTRDGKNAGGFSVSVFSNTGGVKVVLNGAEVVAKIEE